MYKNQLKENKRSEKLVGERSQVIVEQDTIIKKLRKLIAKMKGPEKIKEEISALEKELKERKRELELAEEDEDSGSEDPTAEKC
ncbi:hypothetical protein KCU77_g4134, partial [Aureobasidium melanogenum]